MAVSLFLSESTNLYFICSFISVTTYVCSTIPRSPRYFPGMTPTRILQSMVEPKCRSSLSQSSEFGTVHLQSGILLLLDMILAPMQRMLGTLCLCAKLNWMMSS
jgi:hypothetical protein